MQSCGPPGIEFETNVLRHCKVKLKDLYDYSYALN